MNDREFNANLLLLVDGELPHADRCHLLKATLNDSARWRQIALAFIEQQILSEALVRPNSKRIVLAAHPNAPATCVETTIQTFAGPRSGAHWEDPTTSRKKKRPTTWIAAVCLCLAIGFLGGRAWPIAEQEASATNRVAVGDAADVTPNSQLTSKSDVDAISLAEALARSPQPIPVAFRRELMKRGYLITELDRVSKVSLPSGQTVELPVRQVDIRYLGLATFQ